jgi:hypothetical protein
MSTITQRIPHLLSGISQQPDNRKFPGQLRDSVNAFPDYTLGLLKRPGGQYVSELYGASTSGRWFSILRDAQEKYVAQYDDNTFRVWNLLDGSPRAVDMGNNTGVPGTCNLTNLKTDLTAYNDAVADTAAELTLLHEAQAEYAQALAGQLDTEELAFETDYNYPVGDITQFLKSGATQSSDGNYLIKKDNTIIYNSSETPEGFVNLTSAGSGYTNGVASNVATTISDQFDLIDKRTTLANNTYTLLPTTTTGSGTGLSVTFTVLDNEITNFIVIGGTGYENGDLIFPYQTTPGDVGNLTFQYRIPSGLTVDTVVESGALTQVLISNQGENYRQGDVITVSGGTGTVTYNTLSIDREVTLQYPLIAKEGYKVYTAITGVDNTTSLLTLSSKKSLMDTAQTNYNSAVTTEATAKANYDAEAANCVISALPGPTLTIKNAGTGLADGTYPNEATDTATSGATGLTVDLTISGGVVTEATINTDPGTYLGADIITVTSFAGVELEYVNEAYLKGATADDIELLTLNDYTFVLNKAKTVALTADKSAAKPHEAFVVLKVVGTGHYRIRLDGIERATYNAGTGGDVDAIVVDLAADIDGNTFDGTTFNATVVGPGIYISADAAFTIQVVGGPSEEALFVFQETTPTVADLPTQCKDGYVVRVVNSIDVDVDDMYVKFVADSGATYGAGVWEETLAPEIKYKFDPLTMPHQLVRQADGSFTFGPVSWEDRLVGDETTNPDPSFVGQKINNLFFYRNRLGFLSNEAVVLSKAGDYFNFWATTALTVTDDDPIDITASSVRPVNHRYVRPISVGLVLFSDTEQFILSTDADILSPKTTKINELSSYECDSFIEAVNLGTSLAFVSKTPLFTHMYELQEISDDRPPKMAELTKIVPELIPSDIDSMIASPALSLVSLGTIGGNTVYQYRFLEQNQQRASSWYKWELSGTLLDQFFDSSTYYAVVKNGSTVVVQSYDLTQANEQGFLTLTTGERTDICLDNWNINPYRVHDPNADGSDVTRVYLPYYHVSDRTFSVLALGGYIGGSAAASSESVGAVLYPTVQGTVGAYYVDINGDYRGRNLIIGYIYTMTVELPKLFVIQADGQSAVSDFTSDLIIHRMKVSTGLSGPVKYEVTITGRPEWNQTVEATAPNSYDLNSVNMSADAVHTVPIYQRNENLTFKIIGDTPFPVSLLSLNWEGKYNTGFYRRS